MPQIQCTFYGPGHVIWEKKTRQSDPGESCLWVSELWVTSPCAFLHFADFLQVPFHSEGLGGTGLLSVPESALQEPTASPPVCGGSSTPPRSEDTC